MAAALALASQPQNVMFVTVSLFATKVSDMAYLGSFPVPVPLLKHNRLAGAVPIAKPRQPVSQSFVHDPTVHQTKAE